MLFCVVLGLARLTLTANRDILFLNQPVDDYWFALTAHRSIWSGAYDNMVFAQLQMYAMWLRLGAMFGVPGRLAIDVLWLVGSGWLAFAVWRLSRRLWPPMVLFVYLAFHPYTIALFDRALSENLLACLCVVGLAAMLDVWNLRASGPYGSWRMQHVPGLIASIAFAVAYHTRKEGVVLLAPLLFMALVSWLHRDAWWKTGGPRLAVYLIVGPLIGTIAVGIALAAANESRWGVFARYELAAPNYVRAINALNAIDPEGPTPRWVTVTAATRARAYEVSPTFRELKQLLEGPMVADVVAQTATYGGSRGEIGNGWFYWTIRNMASLAGWHTTARGAEAKYGAMANEIEAAFYAGKLKRRFVSVPFVDPDWRKWAPLLPGAFLADLRQVIAPRAEDLVLPKEDAVEEQKKIYLTIVGRRRPFDHTVGTGWIKAPEGSTVGLGTDTTSETSMIVRALDSRPRDGAAPFHLTASAIELADAMLHIRTPDGGKADLSLRAGNLLQDQTVEPLPEVAVTIERWEISKTTRRADLLLMKLSKVWATVGWILTAAGVLALVWIGHGEARAQNAGRFVLVAVLLAIASRSMLFALLDTSAWSGAQARYLLPAVPFFAAFGIVGLWMLTSRVPRFNRIAGGAVERSNRAHA